MADKRKVQLETSMDATGVRKGTQEAKDSLRDLSQAAQTEGGKAAKALERVGESAQASSAQARRAERDLISSIQRTSAAAEAGQRGTAAYFERLAAQRGVGADALRPYLDQLRQVEVAQKASAAAAAEQARAMADEAKARANSIQAQQAFMASLREQVAMYGKSADEALRYRAAQLGLGTAAAPLILQLQNQRAAQEAAAKAARDEAEAQRQAAAAKKSLEASQQAFLRGLQEQAALQGKSQAEVLRYRAAQLGVAADAEKYIAQLTRTGQAQGQVGVSAAQTAAALRQLPAQFTDIFTSLASGQAPLTVFLQQGGQIKDAFGGIGAAAQALGGYVLGLINPFALGAAAVAALVVAYKQGSAEADEFRRALLLTGNAAGGTVQQLGDAAAAVSRTVGTQGKAAEVIAQLASTGRVAAGDLTKLAEAAIKLEREGGPAVKDTVAAFAELGKNPTQGALKLNESTRFLTVAVLEQVRALEEQGRVAEAARVAQDAYASVSIQRANELTAALGPLERAWRDATDQAKKAWDNFAGIGRADTATAELARIESQLALLRQAGQSKFLLFGPSAAELEAQRRAANRSLLNSTETAASQRGMAMLTEEYEKARKANDRWAEAALSNQQKIDKALAEYRRNLAVINQGRTQAGLPLVSADEVAKQEKAIRAAFQDRKARVKDESSLMAELSGLTSSYTKDLKELQAQREKGLVSEERYVELVTALIAKQPFARDLVREQAEAEKDLAKATVEAVRTREQYLAALDKSLAAQQAETLALQDQFVEISAGKAALQERVLLRMEERAALLELQAIRAYDKNLDEAEYERLKAMAQELRDQIRLRREIAGQAASKEAAEANRKAAEDAQREWQRASDQIGQSLADALMQGGKSAADYIVGLFRAMVLRPLIQAVVQPGATAVLGAFGLSPAGARQGGGVQGLVSGYQVLSSGYNALSSGFASVGSSAANLYGTTYANATGTGLDGFLATNNAFGTAGGAGGTGSAVGSVASTAAGVAAGVYGGRAISGGYAAPGSNSGNSYVNAGTAIGAVVGSIFPVIGTAVGAAVGGIIGGVVNRAFGYKAPEVESRELAGTFTGGNFQGDAVTNILQKGGWFKSDKRTSVSEAITGDLDKALDEGGRQIVELARKYGEALGLPLAALADVSQSIRVTVTGDLAKDTQAIEEALSGYANSLLATFRDELEPLRLSGESVAQVIERVGGALMGVNGVLDTLGITALQTSVAGGKAAVELANAFGGLDAFTGAVSGYYQAYYSEGERVATMQRQLTEVFAQYGAALPATRAQFRAMVEAQDLTTEAGRRNFAALMQVAGAFDQMTTAQDAVAASAAAAAREMQQLAEQVARGLDGVIGDFLSGPELARYRAGRITDTLAGGGIQATVDGVLNATRDDIVALWRTVGVEGQQAILAAYGAWVQMREGIAQGVQSQIDEILEVYGDVSVVADPVKTLAESYVENRDRLLQLESGLQALIGATAKTAQEALADVLQAQRALQSYRGSLRDQIDSARLDGMSPAERVRALAQQETSLFGELETAADPVSVAQRLSQVVLARIREEDSIRRTAAQEAFDLAREQRQVQIDALQQMVSGAQRLKQLAIDIAQFTATARFGDLSPLSYADQLMAARGLFDSTAARAPTDEAAQRNLLGNAQAYLQELAAYTPVGTPEFAREWARVMGVLDGLGVQGQQADPAVAAAQAQIAALEKLNAAAVDNNALLATSSADTVARLTSIDAVLARREAAGEQAMADLIGVARQEIEEVRALRDGQADQLRALYDLRESLTEVLQDLLGGDSAAGLLERARP